MSVCDPPLWRGVVIFVTELPRRAPERRSFVAARVVKFIAPIKFFLYPKIFWAVMQASDKETDNSESDDSNSEHEPEGDITQGHDK